MKRIITAILAFVMTFSVVCASAEVPDFLVQEYPNYTGDYSVSLTFESSEELAALLDEIEIPKEVGYFVNIKSLLRSLLSNNVKMRLEMNMSEDFRKGEYALTAETGQTIDVNRNLNINYDAKMGMWMKMDLDAQKPVFEIIYSAPFIDKYFVMDIFEMTGEGSDELSALYGKMFSKEYMEEIKELSKDLLRKYADIKVTTSSCVVRFDNQGFVGMLNELFKVVTEKASGYVAESLKAETDIIEDDGAEGEPEETEEAESEFFAPEAQNDYMITVLPDFSNYRILGEDGIVCTFSLSGGKVTRMKTEADFSFDISEIAKGITGAEWQYESSGIMDFVLNADVEISKIGKTKVLFPEITEENSFGIESFMPENAEPDYEYEEEAQYPFFYAWAEAEELPLIDDELYVPFRGVLEGAYGDSASIEYSGGVVTAKSEYFPGFNEITLTVKSEDVYTDQEHHKTSKVIIKNNRVYVSKKLFEEIFGWELAEATHDILNNIYWVGFYTESF